MLIILLNLNNFVHIVIFRCRHSVFRSGGCPHTREIMHTYNTYGENVGEESGVTSEDLHKSALLQLDNRWGNGDIIPAE